MIYLDNAATSFPKPCNVSQKVIEIVTEGTGTPGRGSHNTAAKALSGVQGVRKSFIDFFNLLEDFRIQCYRCFKHGDKRLFKSGRPCSYNYGRA